MDLYFAATTTEYAMRLLIKRHKCILLSFLNDKNAVDRFLKLKSELNSDSKIIIDSGAYTAHTKDLTLDPDAYIKYINEYSSKLDYFINLDVIPGVRHQTVTEYQIEEGAKQSWENYVYICDRVIDRDKILPVFHIGEDFKYLINMLEHRWDDGQPIKYLCIAPGSSGSTKEKNAWLDRCFTLIKESSNPNINVHVLGMTIPKLCAYHTFYSADSTSGKKTAAFGSILIPDFNKLKFNIIPITPESEKNSDHISKLSDKVQDEIKEKAQSYGFTWEELTSEFGKRHMLNLLVTIDMFEHIEKIRKTDKQLKPVSLF